MANHFEFIDAVLSALQGGPLPRAALPGRPALGPRASETRVALQHVDWVPFSGLGSVAVVVESWEGCLSQSHSARCFLGRLPVRGDALASAACAECVSALGAAHPHATATYARWGSTCMRAFDQPWVGLRGNVGRSPKPSPPSRVNRQPLRDVELGAWAPVVPSAHESTMRACGVEHFMALSSDVQRTIPHSYFLLFPLPHAAAHPFLPSPCRTRWTT